MKHWKAFRFLPNRLIAIVLATILVVVGQVGSTTALAAETIPGEYLVKYKDNPFLSMVSIQAIPSLRVVDHHADGKLLKIKINLGDEPRTLIDLFNNPNVQYVVSNIKIRAFTAPVDPVALRDQWAIKKVNAEAAWKKAGNKGSNKVLVAVIDTGVDYNHESLKPNMVPGYDFKENDADPYDKTSAQNPGHGTHCAGIIGATGLVENGIVGLSPNVSIMPLRFLGEDGSGDLNAGIKSIDYAIKSGAKVISASWGATIGRAQAQPLVEAVKRADDAGVTFVVAAANDGRNNDVTEVYPANAGFPNSIAVAASGPSDEKPNWSNYGKRTVHVAAPGLNIMSTLPKNGYGNLSGTSMATPLVSGLVALLMSQDPTLTGAQARALLQLTGAKANIDTACNCRVDALAAMDALLEKKMFITPAAASLKTGETMQFTGTNGQPPFEFAVSNASVGSISQDGLFTAASDGETTVTVKDSKGQISTSLAIRVGGANQRPPDGGGGGPDPGKCPLGDEALCQIICQIEPTLPFCDQ